MAYKYIGNLSQNYLYKCRSPIESPKMISESQEYYRRSSSDDIQFDAHMDSGS
jgi:hypothetical protein